MMVWARSGLVEIMAMGTPVTSEIRSSNYAQLGEAAHTVTPWVDSLQPGITSYTGLQRYLISTRRQQVNTLTVKVITYTKTQLLQTVQDIKFRNAESRKTIHLLIAFEQSSIKPSTTPTAPSRDTFSAPTVLIW